MNVPNVPNEPTGRSYQTFSRKGKRRAAKNRQTPNKPSMDSIEGLESYILIFDKYGMEWDPEKRGFVVPGTDATISARALHEGQFQGPQHLDQVLSEIFGGSQNQPDKPE